MMEIMEKQFDVHFRIVADGKEFEMNRSGTFRESEEEELTTVTMGTASGYGKTLVRAVLDALQDCPEGSWLPISDIDEAPGLPGKCGRAEKLTAREVQRMIDESVNRHEFELHHEAGQVSGK